jgi:hypothetical protein
MYHFYTLLLNVIDIFDDEFICHFKHSLTLSSNYCFLGQD